MGDEFDVDDLLEAPYKVKTEPEIAPFFASTLQQIQYVPC